MARDCLWELITENVVWKKFCGITAVRKNMLADLIYFLKK